MEPKACTVTPWTVERDRKIRLNVPAPLREKKQWVCWRYVWREDKKKWDKLPYCPKTGELAKSNDPSTWTFFDRAMKAYKENSNKPYDGVGFMFAPNGGICGVDLDDCRGPVTKRLKSWAKKWLKRLDSYTEVSPSGRGVKVFIEARKPGEDCRRAYEDGEIEIYDHKRYFTVTGRVLDKEYSNRVEPRQEPLALLYRALFHKQEEKPEATEGESDGPTRVSTKLSDERIIELAKNSKSDEHRKKFLKLWHGKTAGYRSASEADGALACLLVYYSRSPKQLRRLMQKSKLHREKWEREDYLNRTIKSALKKVKSRYHPTPTQEESIANLELVRKTEDGKVTSAVRIGHIQKRVAKLSSDWPRNVNGVLFTNSHGHIRMLEKEAGLFSWLHDIAPVRWNQGNDTQGVSVVTKSEFYEHLRNSTTNYESVEEYPHVPKLPNFYYAWHPPKDYQQPTGKYLAKLLSFFNNPEHQLDAALIKAAFLTPAWGGLPGKRPAIVIVSPDRGYGKSTMADVIGSLYGGHVEFLPNEMKEYDFLTRLLSPEAMTKRVVRLDNLSGTYGSKLLESFVTSTVISAKRMYYGEGRRPNTLTTICTGTNVKLSRDLSERAFFIRLRKPERRKGWDDEVINFVNEHRQRILADVVMTLKQKPTKFKLTDRWLGWIAGVVAVCTNQVDDLIALNEERRGAYDEEREDADAIRAAIRRFLEQEGKDEEDDVFVSSLEMVEVLREGLNEPLTARSAKARLDKHIETGNLKGVCWHRTKTSRGYRVTLGMLGSEKEASQASSSTEKGRKSAGDGGDAGDAFLQLSPNHSQPPPKHHSSEVGSLGQTRIRNKRHQRHLCHPHFSVENSLQKLWRRARPRLPEGVLGFKRHKRHLSEEN